MNDLRVFLHAWQDMELASPAELVCQIETDVALEPIPAEGEVAEMGLALIVMQVLLLGDWSAGTICSRYIAILLPLQAREGV